MPICCHLRCILRRKHHILFHLQAYPVSRLRLHSSGSINHTTHLHPSIHPIHSLYLFNTLRTRIPHTGDIIRADDIQRAIWWILRRGISLSDVEFTSQHEMSPWTIAHHRSHGIPLHRTPSELESQQIGSASVQDSMCFHANVGVTFHHPSQHHCWD